MNKVTYAGDNQKKIERFQLGIYSIYSLILIALATERNWDSWVGIFMLLGLGGSWILHVSRYRTYSFRAKFTAVMMQGTILLYATHVESLTKALPVYIVSVVLLGLYGIADIIGFTVFPALFLFFYFGVILKSVPFGTMEEIVSALLQVGNVLVLEYVVYVWTKRNREGSEQLLEAIEELRAVENSKDDFLANVSHEIRTPINTICGMSELVLREELPVTIKEKIVSIQIAGRNLISAVSDILDFSELQSGKMELEEEAYNLTSTINDVINMALAKKNEKKIELIVDCDANIPSVLLGDEKKLRRVILNLVDNAIKFTEEGCVTIGISCRKEFYGINLIITVKDTGIGMDDESIEKIFASFSQVDAKRNRQEGGLGLGLAISQALVKKMGGAITVKSRLGKGSTVRFVIPQKVLDETPIAAINNRGSINVATYIDMEQFDMAAIRDEYTGMIVHMAEQLRGKCHMCRNLAELQRREEKEHFSHVFTSIVEYRENAAYFDQLAQKTNVVVVLDRFDEKYVTNPYLLKIYKPFYILTIVSVLNGSDTQEAKGMVGVEKFVTKDTHVLVVDDNRMNIRVIEGLLDNYNIQVSIATSGQAALEKITSANYDFVFMDHMMPEMDGVETMQRIRHKVGTYYQKVPIIALTANAVAGTREILIKQGFNDFLEKPVERSVLERVLKRNLSPEKIVYKEMVIPSVEQPPRDAATIISPDTERTAVEVMAAVEKAVENPVEKMAERPTVKPAAKAEVTLPAVPNIPANWETELKAEGLDIESGFLYCNGREQYIKVLQGYCEDCDEAGIQAEQLFIKSDWKNYTIAVHGMKSAMRSIGAITISEIAKGLEFAGKEDRIDYIREHHQELLDEYNGLFSKLRQKEWLCPRKEEMRQEKDVSEYPMLDSEELEQLIANMEDAMYALDGDCLLEILSEMENCQYCGVPLHTVCAPAKRKVEMCDFVSAVEVLVRFKSGVDNKEVNA